MKSKVETTGTVEPNKSRDWFVIRALLLLLLFFVIQTYCFFKNHPLPIELADTDCYMRLVRVEQLYNSGAWFDHSVQRSNAPFGEVLHWSRLLDILLIAGAWLLTPFLGFSQALFWWGVLISPVLLLVSLPLFFWAVRALFDREIALWLCILFASQAGIRIYFDFGHPDHHSLLLFLFIFLLGWTVRLLRNPENSRYAAAIGITGATAMWVSVETMAPLGMLFAVLTLLWLWRDGAFCRTLQKISFTALLGMAAYILVERPFGQFFVIEYDKLSWVHIAVFLLYLLAVMLCEGLAGQGNRGRRLASFSLAMLLFGCGVKLLWPAFFKGPFASVDSRIIPIWLGQVREVQPLFAAGSKSVVQGAILLGNGLWAILYLLICPFFPSHKPDRYWLLFVCGAVIFVGLTLYQIRWVAYAEILLLLPTGFVLAGGLKYLDAVKRPLLRSVARVVLLAFLAMGSYLAVYLPAAQNLATFDKGDSGELPKMDRFLNRYNQPQTILTDIDFGPQILYETRHSVIATPYHRNSSGILYLRDVLASHTDEGALALLRERNVNLLLMTKTGNPTILGGTEPGIRFNDRILTGNYPRWLLPVTLPDEQLSKQFLLFTVDYTF